MKIPGADHPIAIAPKDARVVVRFRGAVVAASARALELREADYPPVLYFPRADIDAAFFEPSAHRTHCPYKGDASYLSLRNGEAYAENAVWSYEEPYPAVAAIRGHVAFYPDRVDIEIG